MYCDPTKNRARWAGVQTSATFLWNSASIRARYSAISLSASSFACRSLADLAVEPRHLCLHCRAIEREKS
jgi:hypothetical protein